MNDLAQSAAFQIEVTAQPTAICVRLAGDANIHAIEPLGASLTDVHARAIAGSVTEVVVDVRQLEFMNSACVNKVVTWITRVEAEVGKRYKIRFQSNPKIHWQRRSLRALMMFALDLVSVDV